MSPVTETLSVGLEGEQTFTVTREMSPPHLPVPVLSTPTMVQLIEQTCLLSVQPLLEEGQTTVGTHICVSHVKAAAEGQDVTVHSRLTEINKRRLTFEVTVDGPAGRLSEGTHQTNGRRLPADGGINLRRQQRMMAPSTPEDGSHGRGVADAGHRAGTAGDRRGGGGLDAADGLRGRGRPLPGQPRGRMAWRGRHLAGDELSAITATSCAISRSGSPVWASSPGEFGLILAGNVPEHAVADLALIHARGSSVSLYSTLAPEQIIWIANHCGGTVAFVEDEAQLETMRRVKPEVPTLRLVVLMRGQADPAEEWVMAWDDVLARGRAAAAAEPTAFDRLWQQIQPEDLLSLIYTSGTTGTPKGVMYTHRNIIWTAESIARLVGDGGARRRAPRLVPATGPRGRAVHQPLVPVVALRRPAV